MTTNESNPIAALITSFGEAVAKRVGNQRASRVSTRRKTTVDQSIHVRKVSRSSSTNDAGCSGIGIVRFLTSTS